MNYCRIGIGFRRNSSSEWRTLFRGLDSSRGFATVRRRSPGILGSLAAPEAGSCVLRVSSLSMRPVGGGWALLPPQQRGFAAAASVDLSSFYRIEANNAARSGATMLTVSGPDIDGILASMTVALALKGCSLVELHAAKTDNTHHQHQDHTNHTIHDTFYVVDRNSGLPFPDEELEDLATSLLEALKTPMNIINVSGAVSNLEEHGSPSTDQPQITIVPSGDEPQS